VSIDRFNVRVYGLLVQQGMVLLSHEMIAGRPYLKFPGGGLEYGEGPQDAVVREFMEEAQIRVRVARPVHITGNFVQSAFRANDQVLGLYYEVEAMDAIDFPTIAPAIDEVMRTGQQLYWASLKEIGPDNLSFEIDRAALSAYLALISGC
jgi:8-oxo-dGTP diphosphatase